MSDSKSVSPLFWVVGAVFLLWNAYGCYMYYMLHTMSDEAFATNIGEASAAVRDIVPAWSTAAFAIGVWGGLLGAILFLMRKKLAFPVFVVSLIAGLISFVPGFTTEALKNATIADGGNIWMMPLMVGVMGVVEVVVSRMKVNKGILT